MAVRAQTDPNLTGDRPAEYVEWDSTRCPLSISLRANLAASLSRATPEQPIDGLLLGEVIAGPQTNVRIDRCLLIDSGYFVQDGVGDPEPLARIVDRFRRDEHADQLVGYFRSRSLRSRQPTASERELMQTHFNGPNDVFLLIDPEGDRLRCEFLVWSGKNLVPYDSAGSDALSKVPVVLSKLRSYRAPRVAWIFLAVLLCAGAAFWTLRHIPRTAPVQRAIGPEDLQLSVERTDGKYKVTWSKDLGRRFPKSSAALEVVENSQRREILVGHDVFRSGYILYAPSTASVRFRMTVTLDGDRQFNETVQAIGSEFKRVRSLDPEPVRAEGAASRIVKPAPPPVRAVPATRRVLATLPAPRQTAAPVVAETMPATALDAPITLHDPVITAPRMPEPVLPALPQPSVNRSGAGATAAPVAPRIKRQLALVVPGDLKPQIRQDMTIQVKAYIDATGRVTRCEAVRGSSYVSAVLGRVAEETTGHWLFSPAMLHGIAVPSEFVVQYQIRAAR